MRDRFGNQGLLSDDNRPLVCFEQKGRRYRATNGLKRRVLRYQIDGGLIENGGKCDFAMGIPNLHVVCFIELKGSDLKKAARQLLSTIKILGTKIEKYLIHCRIVLTRISRPDLRSSDLILLERKLAQKKGTVRRSTMIMDENIEQLVL